MRKTLSFFAAVAILLTTVNQMPAKAAEPNQFTISPAQVDVELSDANPIVKTQISITNTYLSDIQLTAQLKGIDEISGKLLPVGNVEPMLAQNIILSKTNFIAPAKGSTILEITVKNSASLESGGHYATLVLQQKQNLKSSYSSQISINIFIIKRGGEREDIDMKILDIRQSVVSLPQNIQVAFTNKGNTHVTPRASAIISTSGGVIVAKGVANSGSQPLLPGKSLTSAVEVKQMSFRWFPQKLLLSIDYRVDGSEVVKKYQKSFWYIPPVFLAGVIVVSTLLFAGMRRLLVWKNTRSKRSAKRNKQNSNLGDTYVVEQQPEVIVEPETKANGETSKKAPLQKTIQTKKNSTKYKSK